jgi:hypothetical protein
LFCYIIIRVFYVFRIGNFMLLFKFRVSVIVSWYSAVLVCLCLCLILLDWLEFFLSILTLCFCKLLFLVDRYIGDFTIMNTNLQGPALTVLQFCLKIVCSFFAYMLCFICKAGIRSLSGRHLFTCSPSARRASLHWFTLCKSPSPSQLRASVPPLRQNQSATQG